MWTRCEGDPSLLAQTALTLDHLSRGRFILGLGSGELENTVPYGFDFSKPVSRFEESLKVIRLLWDTNGPVDFTGQFYKLQHARLDTEPCSRGRFPRIWTLAPLARACWILPAVTYADGWWGAGSYTPEDYASKLKTIRDAAERAGRDPLAITPAHMTPCLIGDDAEVAEIVQAPLVKAYLLQVSAEALRQFGFQHPLGDGWRGIHDFNPGELTRERIVALLEKVDVQAILAIVPHGTPQQIARHLKGDFMPKRGHARVQAIRLRRYGRAQIRRTLR